MVVGIHWENYNDDICSMKNKAKETHKHACERMMIMPAIYEGDLWQREKKIYKNFKGMFSCK